MDSFVSKTEDEKAGAKLFEGSKDRSFQSSRVFPSPAAKSRNEFEDGDCYGINFRKGGP